jgi:NAD+ synthase
MAQNFRLTIAQMNATVGDISGNAAKALAAWNEGKVAGADMVALPEMFIAGYQAQDLIMKPAFGIACLDAIENLARQTADGPALGIGGPLAEGDALHNVYFILQGGKVAATVRKHHLPNYAVFDEKRVFESAPISGPVRVGPLRLGIPICEDSWFPDVAEAMAESGAEVIFVPNGSPYYRDKFDRRLTAMVSRVIENDLPLIYLNLVGAQDDQMFDGGSFALNRGAKLALQLPLFDEVIQHIDLDKSDAGWVVVDGPKLTHPGAWERDYRVMVQCLRDYMAKTGFKQVLLGLSGGIDSALVATIATDALGAENVRCVMLPSEYTSQGSLDDAKAVAENLGCRYDFVPITESRQAVTSTLAPLFAGTEPGLPEENIQSRLRGLLLMALSNKFGEMLLTTGNKSEVAVGYATIYGDMAGGYNPIKDLYKMRVFETCRWRNDNHRDWMKGPSGTVIPPTIIDKPPSAELRPDQKDEDSLPPYKDLDVILEQLVDHEASVAEVVGMGFDRDLVKKVENMIYISEYKRFQSAPGPRLTPRAFWLDRRYPIVNRWRDPS